ncbi:hypothetical protein VNO77_03223 [Canavalia gladiata]|uniref:Uncharacterized protein n=1 Tax=Canavalia gladiata TaxID=3824 RepID=A0AAN9MZH5_CANGL
MHGRISRDPTYVEKREEGHKNSEHKNKEKGPEYKKVMTPLIKIGSESSMDLCGATGVEIEGKREAVMLLRKWQPHIAGTCQLNLSQKKEIKVSRRGTQWLIPFGAKCHQCPSGYRLNRQKHDEIEVSVPMALEKRGESRGGEGQAERRRTRSSRASKLDAASWTSRTLVRRVKTSIKEDLVHRCTDAVNYRMTIHSSHLSYSRWCVRKPAFMHDLIDAASDLVPLGWRTPVLTDRMRSENSSTGRR